jgi:hypothetical protein
MNNINLGPNLTIVNSKVNLGDIFMIEYTGDNHWYSPYIMTKVNNDDYYLIGLENGIAFGELIFYHPTRDEVCSSIENEGNYECSYVGSCTITIER